MPVLSIEINEEVEDKLATVLGGLALLGVSSSVDEIMSYIIEEGLDVVAESNARRMRVLKFARSFEQVAS